MSSVAVRNAINDFVQDFLGDPEVDGEVLIDLTARYEEIHDLIDSVNTVGEEKILTMDDPWTGIEFIGYDEIPVSLGSGNRGAVYRETGAFQIHIVDLAKIGCGATILSRAEALRDELRGKNISGVRIESMTPVSFDSPGTLQFGGGFATGSFLVAYEYDRNLSD